MNQHQLGRFALAASLAISGLVLADAKDSPAAGSGQMIVLKDTIASPGTLRASKLLDAAVYDPAGKDVGTIKEIVFNGTYDAVDYAVVTHGMLGSRKLLALPYKALTLGGPADERVYVQVPLDVIQKAPGFDESKWPTAANADYYRSLDAYYNTHLTAAMNETLRPDEADKARVAAGVVEPAGLLWSRRATDLIGRDVVSPTGERLGSIRDLVIGTKAGDIRYAVLLHAPGMSEKYYAVPLTVFKVNPEDKKLVLAISSDELKATPSFNAQHWPDKADPRWAAPSIKSDIVK